MENALHGKKVSLRSATLNDRRQVYEWLAHSDITQTMLGMPHFPGNQVPSWEEFIKDYGTYFFDGSRPLDGRSFIILLNREAIGHINYNKIYNFSTELDIWLASARFTGKGYGGDAIEILSRHLHGQFDLKKMYIAPSRRNTHAIASYKKAGFDETTEWPTWFVPAHDDTVVMVKNFFS